MDQDIHTPDGITGEVVYVTPAFAADALLNNHSNRPLRRSKVQNHARDMMAGEWYYTGDAIRFATIQPDDSVITEDNERLAPGTEIMVDGQHRFYALLMAARDNPNFEPIPFKIERGYRYAVQRVIDTGAARDIGDVLHMEGYNSAKALAAITRRVNFYLQNWHMLGRKFQMTNSEMIDAIEKDLVDTGGRLQRATEYSRRNSGTVLSGAVLGALHYLFSTVDVEFAAWFLDKVNVGDDLPKYHPIWTLRDRIQRERKAATSGHRQVSDAYVIAYVIIAWNHTYAAHRRGKEPGLIKRIQISKGGMTPRSFKVVGFPYPEDAYEDDDLE